MSGWPDIDVSALKRVAGAADVLMSLGAPLPDAEQDWVCRQLGARSEPFRAARRWTRWYRLALLIGTLLFAVALTFTLLGLSPWLCAALWTASMIVIFVPSIRVYRIVRQGLTMAVGAYAVVVSGNNDTDR